MRSTCATSIMDKLISFALPLMLSGILQLMFNAVDIVVVGRFSGSQALAAVGSTTALINVFTNCLSESRWEPTSWQPDSTEQENQKKCQKPSITSITLALITGCGEWQ